MRIDWNDAGFDALLTSGQAQALVTEHADAIAEAANAVPSTTAPAAREPYYVVDDASDEHRARARVRTNGPRAANHEAKTQALQQGLSHG